MTKEQSANITRKGIALALLLIAWSLPLEIQAQVGDGEYAVVTVEGKNTYEITIEGKQFPSYRHGRVMGGSVYYVDPAKGWAGGSVASVTLAKYEMPAVGDQVYTIIDFDFGNGPGNKVFKAKVVGVGTQSFDTGKVFLEVEADLGAFKYEGTAHHYATEAEYKALGWPPVRSMGKPDVDGSKSPVGESNAAVPAPARDAPAPKPAAPGSGFKIIMDYSKADASFTPAVKKQFEEAAEFLQSFIADDREVVITVVSDPKVTAFAQAGPSAWETNSDTKAAPIAGGIAYKPSSITDVDAKQSSIVSLTIHEMLHILGFTESHKAYAKHVSDGQFKGPITMKMNNGQPVAGSGGHFDRGVVDTNGLSPRMSDGGGDLLSVLDLAVLADLGYNIPVLNNASTPPLLGFKIQGGNSMTMRYPDGTPAFLLQGYGGNDILIAGDVTTANGKKATFLMAAGGGDDVLVSGPGDDEMRGDNSPAASYGKDGKDTFVITTNGGNDSIMDLDDSDVILLAPEFNIDNLAEYLDKNLGARPVPGTEFTYQGQYQVKLGNVELNITTRDGKKPSGTSFKTGTWQAP